jgi:hypothetical protein
MREFGVRDLPGARDIGRPSIDGILIQKMFSEIKRISEKDNKTLTISSTKNA